MKPYPDHWPKAVISKPMLLATRITEKQKSDLYNRVITTRELAATLGVHEAYLSSNFPGKVQPISQQIEQDMHKKRAIRKVFRQSWAKKVLKKEISMMQAANIAAVSERTMRRIVQDLQLREAHSTED